MEMSFRIFSVRQAHCDEPVGSKVPVTELVIVEKEMEDYAWVCCFRNICFDLNLYWRGDFKKADR